MRDVAFVSASKVMNSPIGVTDSLFVHSTGEEKDKSDKCDC